ncbi:hypothetical protein ACS127_05710 [Amphibacillus sp. Q70]|uniref:hypothetical protein n=1 Tax=Amphibacillus sp. Q70 TaxID=3453416 RepID=UPI003F841D69
MKIMIEKYQNKDQQQLKQLLELCFEDESLLDIVNGSNFKCAYSAIFADKLVGFALVWTSRFHPYCTYFRILSNPFHKFFKTEEKLFAKVSDRYIEDSSLQTSLWETSMILNKLYQEKGFKEIRRTYISTLKIANIEMDNCDIEVDYTIKTLKEVLLDRTLTDELTYLVKSNYEQTHKANPVANLSTDQWKRMIFADDVISDGSYFFLDENKKSLVAYSFLHESDEEDSLELGWCGATDFEDKYLISQLIFYQLKYASKHDIKFLIGEFDTTDPSAMEVMTSFPFDPSPAWVTYRN